MKAFPQVNVIIDKDMVVTGDQRNGMDLRDYFAAHAMQSLMLDENAIAGLIELGASVPATLAKLAYRYADAMMKAREA